MHSVLDLPTLLYGWNATFTCATLSQLAKVIPATREEKERGDAHDRQVKMQVRRSVAYQQQQHHVSIITCHIMLFSRSMVLVSLPR